MQPVRWVDYSPPIVPEYKINAKYMLAIVQNRIQYYYCSVLYDCWRSKPRGYTQLEIRRATRKYTRARRVVYDFGKTQRVG